MVNITTKVTKNNNINWFRLNQGILFHNNG